MIINEAQSRSKKEGGMDLREECFSHMWLAKKLVLQKTYIYWRPQKKITNVVHKEVLC
jgi:hypothetical protein